MLKIEHIGIAVNSLEEATERYSKLLGTSSYKTEEVELEGVITSFFKVGDNKVELLEATTPDSAIASFIEKRGEGLHHIAFLVDDIEKEMSRLLKEGFEFTGGNKPFIGADNKLVCFVHPKSANGVLVELCQEV